MSVPAASTGTLLEYWPTKKPRPAGAVLLLGSWIRISTSRNWFQDHMKNSTAMVESAGTERGTSTRRRIVNDDAPSICAASMSSRGMTGSVCASRRSRRA